MHTVHRQGAGAGGRVSPYAHSPLPPSLSQTYHSYTPRRSRHTWGPPAVRWRLTVSHMKNKEEAVICRTGDVECRRRRGYAGQGMWNAGKEEEAGM